MWIQRVEIENYKSFFRPQTMEFAEGFNLILGANNSGKSTVLQALSLNAPVDAPHRSIANVQEFGQPIVGTTRTCLTWAVPVSELRQLQKGEPTYLPHSVGRQHELTVLTQEALRDRLLAEVLLVSMERSPGAFRVKVSGDVVSTDWLDSSRSALLIRLEERSGQLPVGVFAGNHSSAADLLSRQFGMCSERVYRFDARRYTSAHGPLVQDGKLDATASNLPGCITWLQTNDPEGHRLLCELVRRVLPHVCSVQAPPLAGNPSMVELRCYPRPTVERRGDLSVPISEMGAGVVNVVAILFVLLTARHPQVICIDEPNQFLHPKALRELLSILSIEGRQHQYILTAHSADVIGAIKAETVTLLSLDGGQTAVQQAKHHDLALLRDGLADLGIRATELHGRDQVLWVEGQTEEIVFPTLLTNFCKVHAAGTAVLRVHDTGAFERRGFDPIKAVEIYTRLTKSSALVPPMVAIVLDRESRQEAERERLENDRRGRLRFLPRRMLENFLLHPQAIAATLNEHESGCCDVDAVSRALCKLAVVESADQINLIEVDGANLLSQVFNAVTDARWEFKKTRDVPIMVDWLLANDVGSLKPLGDWLSHLLAEVDVAS